MFREKFLCRNTGYRVVRRSYPARKPGSGSSDDLEFIYCCFENQLAGVGSFTVFVGTQ
jgi:hypothetical protein